MMVQIKDEFGKNAAMNFLKLFHEMLTLRLLLTANSMLFSLLYNFLALYLQFVEIRYANVVLKRSIKHFFFLRTIMSIFTE